MRSDLPAVRDGFRGVSFGLTNLERLFFLFWRGLLVIVDGQVKVVEAGRGTGIQLGRPGAVLDFPAGWLVG